MQTLVKKCRIISPEFELSDAAIAVENGMIEQIFKPGEDLPDAEMVYDAEGKMAVPGFIDIHFHGNSGFDVVDGTVEGIRTIAECKLKEGVTSICPTTLTVSEEQLVKSVESVAEYQKNPIHSKVAGIHLEGPFICDAMRGAQNPEFIRMPDMEEVRRLNNIAKVAIVSFAVELEGGIQLVRELVSEGIIPSCGHSNADYATYRKAIGEGLKHLTHFCNQMTKLHHREIGLVGGGLLDEDIKLEMICDKIHLCPDMIRLVFKSREIEKIMLVTDTMCAAWLDDGDYDLGGLEVKVENGAARLKSNDALAGSTLKYYNALKNVYEITGLPLTELIKTTSLNQARSLGCDDLGKIEAGFKADITVLNDDFTPSAVFVDGEKRLEI